MAHDDIEGNSDLMNLHLNLCSVQILCMWHLLGTIFSLSSKTASHPSVNNSAFLVILTFDLLSPLSSTRQHSSYGVCLEVKREYYQNCSVLDCVTQNVHSLQHTYMSSSYRFNRLGLSLWDPYAVHKGGCLQLYYCNMVEWFRWNSSLILTTNCFL